MPKEKKILLIAHAFPPCAMSGVHRTIGFVRHLPKNGWEPFVLTIHEDGYELKDFSLSEKIPDTNNIYRVPYWDNKVLQVLKKNKNRSTSVKKFFKKFIYWFAIPDNMNRWIPNAYRAGKRIISDQGIDVIWSTSPTNSSHLVGYLLKRKFGIPWVADFRDPWMTELYGGNYPKLYRKLNNFLELRVALKANKIVAVSEKLKGDLKTKHPNINFEKISVITNGFEEEDFKKKYYPTGKFTVTHAGNFYGKRTPIPFLRAVKQLFFENPEMEKLMRIRFIGTFESYIEEEIRKIEMWNNIEIIPYVPHSECIEYECRSDVLLLIPGPNTLTIPGKFFEYMATGRPILALTKKDTDSSVIIKETKSGVIADPDDVSHIKEAILDLFDKYKKGTLNSEINQLKIKTYLKSSLTARLASILDGLCDPNLKRETK